MTLTTVMQRTKPELADITSLSRHRGLAISVYLAGHQGGAGTQPVRARLERALGQLKDKLEKAGVAEAERAALLAPMFDAAADPELEAGHREGFAMFRARDSFRQFVLPFAVEDAAYLEGRFEITPMLAYVTQPHECFVLALARKNLRLFRCGFDGAHEVPLPAEVCKSLEEFMATDQPDHSLRNASSAGPGGAVVAFGTGSERERQGRHMHDWCRSIAQGLRAVRGNVPLVVAGTDEERGTFRNACDDELVQPGLAMVPDKGATPNEIARAAMSLLREWVPEDRRQVIDTWRNLAGTPRGMSELTGIVRFASRGRVQHLVLTSTALEAGNVDHVTGYVPAAGEFVSKEDDLVNAAVVETLRHSGDVWLTPPERGLPKVAAVLRY
ncbi:MAG: hypothetical protein U0Q16_23500 [Bryobacteraceae bacterium]